MTYWYARVEVFADAEQFFCDSKIALHGENLVAELASKRREVFTGGADDVIARRWRGALGPTSAAASLVSRRHAEIAASGVATEVDLDAACGRRVPPRPLSGSRLLLALLALQKRFHLGQRNAPVVGWGVV